ncbi:hypothetical protein ACET3X_008945 [Alternaria dauci]|uniref:FAD-binding PCMH-type domain-containing protein n=1 Tax=Alternaria dauci TaxID=48095 RepID=A0ABR3U7H6_9PLEO
MKNMRAFSYNEADHTVTFGPGNLLGNLSQKLQPLGRVMAYGEVGVIGSGGHMTIGGLGTLSRQLGLAADQILSVQCVVANGSIVTASASTNPDLFFAIRGAGFSFAIVTEFTMNTAQAPPEITQYTYTITAEDTNSFASTFQRWQDFPIRFYAKSVKTTNQTIMSKDTIQEMFSYINATEKGSPVWLVIWDLQGGAISDVSQTATAYWHRDALYFMQSYVVSFSESVSDASKSFLAGLNLLVQDGTGADQSAYPGYVDPELADPQRSYWGCNVPRLQKIKAALDPDNVFHNPQTVSTVYNASICPH